ncbi:hypothetical protein PYH37_001304 [Sinorhizobium numidicum]|uniref:Uncharacterized protein n=1 Tax=Sinorhizobium numidicum TaxID=680248 RepID=A0ABY8CMT2_9HYPH|nr:hypothetical protein [Sinorhizobium numidicum]WEX73944.1 hypothetical protein PYH37_001304 [Sinorhizobium numidicum]WEX79929.1 hypothetical protein PYH38_001305 [Sinorhizobium numidicum]
MTIIELVLASQIGVRRTEKRKIDLDHIESHRVLLRICAFLPVLVATVVALEIAGSENSAVVETAIVD